MKVIVGLGNPGKEYEGTRHNVGFAVIDALREKWEIRGVDRKFEAELFHARLFNEPILLVKPRTFMNLSGASVAAIIGWYKLEPAQDLWVVHDDLDLSVGRLRIRTQGSSGGHRGVNSIIERLKSDAFVRFRLGIGRPADQTPVDDYVLRPFATEESAAAKQSIDACILAIQTALGEGIPRAMTLYSA